MTIPTEVPNGYDQAVANWTAHCECLSSDEHRKSPYWLPLTECWSERRMQDAATLANAHLAEIAARDADEAERALPADEAWAKPRAYITYIDDSFADYDMGSRVSIRAFREQPHCAASVACYFDDNLAIRNPTRGQVTDLLRALGVRK